MTWLPIDHWQTPKGPLIMGRLPDHRELPVKFNPIRQAWVDGEGNDVPRPIMWRALEPDEALAVRE